jgi:maltose phosphorylase
MGGTWMSFVQGFGGMRVNNGKLHFAPILPDKWDGYSFNINFRGAAIKVEVNKKNIILENHSPNEIKIGVYGSEMAIPPGGQIITNLN